LGDLIAGDGNVSTEPLITQKWLMNGAAKGWLTQMSFDIRPLPLECGLHQCVEKWARLHGFMIH
jgi:hypothetical protein